MNGTCYKCSKWPSGEPPYLPNAWNKGPSNILSSHNCYSYMLNDLFRGPRKYHKPQPGWFYKIKTNDKFYDGISNLNCAETIKGVKRDNPDHIKVLSLRKGKNFIPPPYHYKGILVVSPNRDYHFARQDNRLLKVYTKLIKYIRLLNKNNKSLTNQQLIKLIVLFSKKYIPEIYQYIPNKCNTINKKAKFLYKNSKTWSHKPGSSYVTDKDADNKLIFDPLKANWNFEPTGGINYYKQCCFFSIPMNTYKNTYSTGVPSFFQNKSLPKMKARLNISASKNEQELDKRVRKILKL